MIPRGKLKENAIVTLHHLQCLLRDTQQPHMVNLINSVSQKEEEADHSVINLSLGVPAKVRAFKWLTSAWDLTTTKSIGQWS